MKEERKGKGGKEEKKRVIKHTLKYLYEAQITQKNSQKQGRILEGGGEEFFWLARIYTPVLRTDLSWRGYRDW